MRPQKTVEVKSAVITLKVLSDGHLALMDQQGSFRMIDLQSYKTVGGFKTGIVQERAWGNHLSISASGKYAACVIPHTNQAALYSIEKKKLLYTTSRHKGDLESVCIDDENHYFVTGGTDGKTYVWNLSTGRLTYAFPSHADYITALDISRVWIASASYDKTISVLNLTTMNTPIRLSGHSSVVVQIKLLKQMRMISADKTGNILLWDLKSSKLLHRFAKMHDNITSFTLSADEKFLFVGTKLGYVSLYEIEKGECLKKFYLKEESKVTSLCLIEEKNQLVVGTKKGKMNFYSLFSDEKVMIEKLKAKEYAELYAAAEDNPLLYYSKVYLKLDELWHLAMNKAVQMLEAGLLSNAKAILEPFSRVRSKQTQISQLLSDYNEFQKFKQHVEEKRYSLAYSLANRYKHFKQSSPYKAMENEWHLQFNKAKALVLNKDGDEKIRTLLSNFKGISEKSSLIQQLFQQRTAYSLFCKKLVQKDFISLFSLLERCPFIKEFDEYDKLLDYADNFYIKASHALQNKEYPEAISYATELINFPDLKDDAQEIIESAKTSYQFAQAFEREDIASMYEMIGKYPYLSENTEARALEKEWSKHLEVAEKYAAKADVQNVCATLKDFFEIKAKHAAIAVVIQQAYISQLHHSLRSNISVAAIEDGIKQYVAFFGIDDHIENFYEKFAQNRQTRLDISRLHKGSIHLFRPSFIIPDIVKG